MSGHSKTPALGRRLLCLVYDALLLTALVLFSGGIATVLAQLLGQEQTRLITQAVVPTLCTGYFVWQWIHGGQTLPMKTWRIRLESSDDHPLRLAQTMLRALLAVIGYACLGISVVWAIADKDGQFLHDRLSGTRLVITE